VTDQSVPPVITTAELSIRDEMMRKRHTSTPLRGGSVVSAAGLCGVGHV
jgi:hypothetical protein